jgi:hypothetical protein
MDYSDEELEALPQTTTVFDVPQLKIDDHIWVQQGNHIIEQCHDHRGIPIPAGTMLVKGLEGYKLVDEVTRQ